MNDTDDGRLAVTTPGDTQILLTRWLDAPKEKVFRAWTTPELVKRWWAGRRGTVVHAEIDLRVGGSWRYVLKTGDGTEVGFHGEYREVVPNERLVHTEVFEQAGPGGDPADVPLNTVTFTETDGRTLVSLLVDCPSTELRDIILHSGMETGVREQFAILDELVPALAG